MRKDEWQNMQFIYWSVLIGIGLALIIVFFGKAAAMMVCGLCCVFCAVMNYEWFMINNKSAPVIDILGREGARIFYIILGVAIVVLSAFII